MNEQQNNNIIVSFDDITINDFRAYWDAVAKNNWQGQDAFFAKVVQSWDYDLDANNPDSYGQLTAQQYMIVQSAIRQQSSHFAKSSLLIHQQ